MERRDELRQRALDYFLQHGLAELSLRPLAEQIGTSARLLVYHFDSKENLIMAVMTDVRARVQQAVTGMMRARAGAKAGANAGANGGAKTGSKSSAKAGGTVLESIWQWTVDPANLPYVRLLFEVQVLALQHPATYARYLAEGQAGWAAAIEHGMPDVPERRTLATLCGAVIDGLALDYLSNGDLAQAGAALRHFVSLLGAAPAAARTDPHRTVQPDEGEPLP